MRHAACAIQAAFRGLQCRRQLAQQHLAATAVQASWRAFSTRRRFLRLREAAVTLQASQREEGALLGRLCTSL